MIKLRLIKPCQFFGSLNTENILCRTFEGYFHSGHPKVETWILYNFLADIDCISEKGSHYIYYFMPLWVRVFSIYLYQNEKSKLTGCQRWHACDVKRPLHSLIFFKSNITLSLLKLTFEQNQCFALLDFEKDYRISYMYGVAITFSMGKIMKHCFR